MTASNSGKTDTLHSIYIKNSRVHNLKNISVIIPRNKITVITGVSGSGKSSLAFDTLYAEGQRRYAESLSSYVRQFVGKMDKPDVDDIKGISPAIAIEQKVNSRNPRSTVGTSTEIYDYLKLLFARIGKTYSPISGSLVKRDTVSDITDYILSKEAGTTYLILTPFRKKKDRPFSDELGILLQKGFSRIYQHGVINKIEDMLNTELELELGKTSVKKTVADKKKKKSELESEARITASVLQADEAAEEYFIVVDRIVVNKEDDDLVSRISDSVQTALNEGYGECRVQEISTDKKEPKGRSFSNKFEADGMLFEEPSVHLFSFNNPFGACKTCEGLGQIVGVDETLVVPDRSQSIYDGAIACWRGEKMSEWNEQLILQAYKFDFPIHRPYRELTAEQKDVLWTGNAFFKGLNAFFKHLEEQSYKIQYRVMLSRFRGRTVCTECKGTRLRSDAGYVKVAGKSISEIVLMQVKDSLVYFQEISESASPLLNEHDLSVSKRILTEIKNRLHYLCDVGLGYLTLNRLSNTLSGGESQRINLATALGSSLVGSMYILDEPSIGLHPRDTERLIGILKSLRDLGNTVIVVEHDEEIMRAADHLIDLGPGAGTQGGELMYEGNLKDIAKAENSLTAKFLSGELTNKLNQERKNWKSFIEVQGASENNLKNISVKFPLGVMTVVTGVSGSGKSSLVKSILYPAMKKALFGFGEQAGKHDGLAGDLKSIQAIEFIDQNPIGKSSRSNPVTYVKAYDEIRSFYAGLPLSHARGYKPSHFSFNVEGGRCEVCEGSGEMVIEMQFMADIYLRCEACNGKRFRDEILEVAYEGKNISALLEMTVDEAVQFFSETDTGKTNKKADFAYHAIKEKIAERLKPLADVGLGYVRLGQPASTLSGGEAQRIKLASFFGKENESGNTLFLFDEPTTGLHFHDISKLLYCFQRLVAKNDTVIIIEHNPEIIRNADWLIDLGPDGGDNGGRLLYEGLPEGIKNCKESWTGKFLAL